MNPIVELTREQIEDWREALLRGYKEAGSYSPVEFAKAMVDIGTLCDMALRALPDKAGEAVAVSRDWPYEQTYKGWQRSASCYACYVKYYAPCAAPAALPDKKVSECDCKWSDTVGTYYCERKEGCVMISAQGVIK